MDRLYFGFSNLIFTSLQQVKRLSNSMGPSQLFSFTKLLRHVVSGPFFQSFYIVRNLLIEIMMIINCQLQLRCSPV